MKNTTEFYFPVFFVWLLIEELNCRTQNLLNITCCGMILRTAWMHVTGVQRGAEEYTGDVLQIRIRILG